ncbi:MAG: TolB protein [Pseudohongiellaceae bacterium]
MKRVLFFIAVLFLSVGQSQAELTIEITQGRDNPTPIAVAPFSWQGAGKAGEDIAKIIELDLYRSGQFAPMSRSDMLGHPHKASDVHFGDWRRSSVDYLLVGRLTDVAGQLRVDYELFDVYGQKQILSSSKLMDKSELRGLAHHVSDKVYEQLTGIRGAFSTKLLYVSSEKRGVGQFRYRLLLSDIDGAREQVLLDQDQPILTPAWAPDGQRIAYVSFETTRSAVFMYDLRTKQRTQLTNFTGINGSPSWSPDGKQLAMVLSKDGSPDIYVMDIASRQLTRVTRHYAIDTEPSWLPDGKSIVYTSDRGGKPQIYQVTLSNGYEERLTFEGKYNARARVLPDGRGIIMVHQGTGDFHIALLDIDSGNIETLTETALDESPSIAPNGTMLLYATQYRGKGILSAVSIDGGVKFHLPSKFGDVREPAWSPFLAE